MSSTSRSIWGKLRISSSLVTAFGLVLVFSFFVNLLILTSPIYMMQVYDRVLTSSRIETLLYISLIAVLALVVLGLLDGARGFLLLRLGRYLDVSLRDPILAQAIEMSRRSGQSRRKLVDDLNTMRSYVGSPAILPLIDAPWVPFFIVVIWSMHPFEGMLAVGATILLVVLTLANSFLSRGPLREASLEQARAGEFASLAIANSEVVHAMGMQTAVAGRYGRYFDQASVASQRAGDIGSAFSAATKAIRIAVQSAALGLGAYLVIRGELTPGGMTACSIILGRALAPIEQGIGSWKQVVAAREAYTGIRKFLSAIPAIDERTRLSEFKGRLSVEELYFQLPGQSVPILKRVSFGLEPGSAMALIGPSASGKSTLCRLLVGSYPPTSGSVRLDAAEVSDLNPDDVRGAIGYLPQNVELFAGTVRENIARLGTASDEAVIAAARDAGCHEMILRLEHGYETQLGPSGLFLSGGQRQRIGLARALFGMPRLVVLDEPNSNLDQEGEAALIEAIRKMKAAGSTVVVVSHRSSLLAPVDKLGLLRDGVLERFGNRDEVLRDIAPQSPQQQPARPTLVSMGDGTKGKSG